MANILPDGTVIPSHITVANSYERQSATTTQLFNNVALRVGYTVAAHYPGEAGYEDEHFVLYDVVCPSFDGQGARTYHTFRRCRVLSLLGAKDDLEKIRFRVPNGYNDFLTDEVIAQASAVTILCANGRANTAYIVAGTDHADAPVDDKSDGVMWRRVFNGVEWLTNKDGEHSITFNGPTRNAQGDFIPPDKSKAGTLIKLDKEGGVLIDNARGESVYVDKQRKRISIRTRTLEENVTEGDWTVEVNGKAHIHAKGNVTIDSDGEIRVGSDAANENLVLGKKLLAAFQELLQALSTAPIGALGAIPIPPHPALVARLQAWKAAWATSPKTSPMLSKKRFTE